MFCWPGFEPGDRVVEASRDGGVERVVFGLAQAFQLHGPREERVALLLLPRAVRHRLVAGDAGRGVVVAGVQQEFQVAFDHRARGCLHGSVERLVGAEERERLQRRPVALR